MKRVTSVHQPSYFPWQGLLNKIKESEIFILLDDVQLLDRGYQHRNTFLDKELNTKTLTIPILKKGYREKGIKDILLADDKWQKKHFDFLLHNYNRHAFFEEIIESIKPLYEKDYKYLIDVLLDSMLLSFEFFDIDTEMVMQSELDYDKELKKSELILELLQKCSSRHYLSGHGAKSYQDDNAFNEKGIELSYTNYEPVGYEQHGTKEFISGLSSLDLLFNVGKKNAYKYI